MWPHSCLNSSLPDFMIRNSNTSRWNKEVNRIDPNPTGNRQGTRQGTRQDRILYTKGYSICKRLNYFHFWSKLEGLLCKHPLPKERGACTIKHYTVVMYGLRSKPSVFFQASREWPTKTLAYYVIYLFPLHCESKMFDSTGPRWWGTKEI